MSARGIPPVAMTIAGTDSGGGAGIAADLRAFSELGVFATLVVTAVTAQNTLGVTAIDEVAAGVVEAQIDAVLCDFPVEAVKTGMLASVASVEVVARRASQGGLSNLVVDPVMVAASGAALITGDVRGAYLKLLPFVTVVTPNLPEAELLLGREVRDERAMADAARELCNLGAGAALVKGGHLAGEGANDAFCQGREVFFLRAKRLATRNVHGTGCTLSAAIAAGLAKGEPLQRAVEEAKAYVADRIAGSVQRHLGRGPGPLL